MLKFSNRLILATVLAAGLAVPATPADDRADVLLQAAMKKEQVDGDLNGAIKQYAAIVSTYVKTNRAVTAMAMVHMAECYQKMGDGESRKIFEQVVREYADQKEAVAMARARLGRSAQPGRQTNTLVWSGDKVDPEGRVSFDGRYVSYTDWNTGDLVLHEIATGTDRRITDTKQKDSGKLFAQGSTISRDGKQIAYHWFNGETEKAELRLASLTGDPNPRRLYDNPDVTWFKPHDWSPDGRSVAVEVSRKDRTAQIGLVSVPDGSLRVLKSVDWRGAGRMFFSPDGKYLGYDLPETDAGPERDVFVLAIDGTREVPVVVHRGNDRMMGWSTDGKRLLFVSDRSGSMDLWGLLCADGRPQGVPELIKTDIGPAASLGLTRSGALYYSIATSGGQRSSVQIASFDLDTGKITSPAKNVTQDYLESNSGPSWSPDGKYLAYGSQRGRMGSANTFLVIRSAETGQVVRELRPKLTYTYGQLANWAPDSRSFLVVGRDFKGRSGTFQMDAETGDLTLLMLDQPGGRRSEYPRWSPDGKSLYFLRKVSGGKEFAFIQRDLASGNEKEVIRRPFLGGFNFSPDGQYIATAGIDSSSNSRLLLLIPIAGGEPRELMRVSAGVGPEDLAVLNKGQWLGGASWASDSRSFLTTKRLNEQGKSNEVWRVPVDGAAPSKLYLGQLGGISPDGKRIASVVAETALPRTEEVWVLENFLPITSASK